MRWTSIPLGGGVGGGGVEILLAASCYGNRDKLRPDEPVGSKGFTHSLTHYALYIGSVLFEEHLSRGLECNCCQQHGASCESVMQRNGKTYFRRKLRINTEDIFPARRFESVLQRDLSQSKRHGNRKSSVFRRGAANLTPVYTT